MEIRVMQIGKETLNIEGSFLISLVGYGTINNYQLIEAWELLVEKRRVGKIFDDPKTPLRPSEEVVGHATEYWKFKAGLAFEIIKLQAGARDCLLKDLTSSCVEFLKEFFYKE